MFDDNEIVQAADTENTEQIEQAAIEPAKGTKPDEINAEKKPSNQEINFKNLREKAEKVARERDEALAMVEKMRQQNQEDLQINLGPDELAEGKHLTKVDKRIQQLEQRLTEAQIESRLQQQFSDFYKVVTKENLDALRDEYPEMSSALHNSTDLYSKMASAYQVIKKFGIGEQNPYKEDVERAQKNSAKPKPLASVSQAGNTPLSHANAFERGLTDEVKSQLLKEMMEARRGY